jgi:serine/threonine protein phosphatase PrpC
MNLKIKVSLALDQGKVRSYNEDYGEYFIPKDKTNLENSGSIFVVSDGVGRSSRGDFASRYAVRSLLYNYFQNPALPRKDRLTKYIQQAGNEINTHAAESDSFRRMATTLVAAVISGSDLTVANVGDSRAYLYREGKIKQITRDHSLIEEMLRNGTLTKEEAARSNLKNRITRSLGGERDVKVDIFDAIQLHPGDKILLCSDGLSRYTSDAYLEKMLGKGEPDQITRKFAQFANRQGGEDNITVLVLEIGQAEEIQDGPSMLPKATSWKSIESELADVDIYSQPQSRDRVWVPYLAGGLAVLVLAVIFGLPFLKGIISGTPAEPQPGLTTDLAADEEHKPTETVRPTETPEPSPTAAEEAVEPEPTPAPTLPALAPCVYTYQQPDPKTYSLYILLKNVFQMDLTYDDFRENYAGNVLCTELDGNPCAYDPSAYEWIQDGWELQLPDIPGEICLIVGGKILVED